MAKKLNQKKNNLSLSLQTEKLMASSCTVNGAPLTASCYCLNIVDGGNPLT